MKIGQNIKKIRGIKNLNQEEFGSKFGLSRATVGAYEEERAVPKLDTIVQIANFIGVSIDQLVTSHLTVNQIHGFKGAEWASDAEKINAVHFDSIKSLVNKKSAATYHLPFISESNLFSFPSPQNQELFEVYQWVKEKVVEKLSTYIAVSEQSVILYYHENKVKTSKKLYGQKADNNSENFTFAKHVGRFSLGSTEIQTKELSIEQRLNRLEQHIYGLNE